MTHLALAATAASTIGMLPGCGDDSASAPADAMVAAAFYPLEYLAEQIGGDQVAVVALTRPGGGPHDLELTPDPLVTMYDTDLVVYLADFQPALDAALGERSGPSGAVSTLATRVATDDEHAEDEHADDENSRSDPRFWNDPTRFAAAGLVAEGLAAADPDNRDAYLANAESLAVELTALDEEAEAALASCAIRTLVTAHDAFGYFADRYGFEVLSIAGISPDTDPSASQLAAVTDAVRSAGVTTIYTETLVSAAIAQTVADETGAATAVLDPLDGLTDESAGADYPSVMRANVATVAQGQECE